MYGYNFCVLDMWYKVFVEKVKIIGYMIFVFNIIL